MTKRIYKNKVLQWAQKNKKVTGGTITGVTLIGLYFIYLSFIGAIVVTGYSGDQICSGTIEDPCYAFINFTANEDIFLYPLDYDPYNRDVEISFSPGVKSWKLERSWGSGWWEIDLNKTCQQKWCGAPQNNMKDNKYSWALREGRDYRIRITAYKNNPGDNIKWAAFGVDPTFYGLNSKSLDKKYNKSNREISFDSKIDKSNKTKFEIKLNTPFINNLHRGNRSFAELTLKNKYGKYPLNLILENLEFSYVENGTNFTRDFYYKYKKVVEVPRYDWICEPDDGNNKTKEECYQILNGTKNEIIEEDLNLSESLKKGEINISIYTDVKKGDYIEWLPTILGIKLPEFAIFNESIDVGLVASYPHNESAGRDIQDFVGNDDNGTTFNMEDGDWTGVALDYDGSNEYATQANLENTLAGGTSISIAFNVVFDALGNQIILNDEFDGALRSNYVIGISSSTKMYWHGEGGGASGTPCQVGGLADIDGGETFSTGVNYTVVLVANTSGIWTWFNGIGKGRVQTCASSFTMSAGGIAPDFAKAAGSEGGSYLNGRLGQVNFWNDTSLNNAEAIEVTGKINGSIAPPDNPPTVTLNNPIDIQNFTTNTIEFSAVCSDDISLANCSLYGNWSGGWHLNVTNSSIVSGAQTNFTLTNFPDGTYIYNYLAVDSIAQQTFADNNRTFNVNTIPTIKVFSPTNTSYTTSTIYFNATNSTPVDKWIVNYNGTNVTLSDINTTLTVEDGNIFQLLLYANNTGTGLFGLNDTIFFTVDVTNPLIDYIEPTFANNTYSPNNWIYVNISVTEPNRASTTFNIFNSSGEWNSTIYSTAQNSINWTDLEDGIYYYNVTVNDTLGNENSTETRWIILDTINPLIEYVDPTRANNTVVDSSIQNWIFVNVSVTELNPSNITFRLFNSSGEWNSTTYAMTDQDENNTINWTDLEDGIYYYNVTIVDKVTLLNSTIIRWIIITQFSFYVEGILGNNTAELGMTLNITVNSTAGITICVDINRSDFGVNYSCSSGTNTFNLTLNSFIDTTFSDGTSSQTNNYTSVEWKNITFDAHQYDEIDFFSFNISGLSSPRDLTIFRANTSPDLTNDSQYVPLIDRWFDGNVVGRNIYLNTFSDSTNTTRNFTYQTGGEKLIYFIVDDILNNTLDYTIFMDLNATDFGVNFTDEFDDWTYIDTSLTNAELDLGEFILTANSSISWFSYDDFEDGIVDPVRWINSSEVYIVGTDCTRNRTTTEGGGYLYSFAETIHGGSGTIDCGAFTNILYSNASKLNLEASDSIEFNISANYIGDEDNSLCFGDANFYLGGSNAWSLLDVDTPAGGIESSTSNLFFNLTKINGTFWQVNLTGYESTSEGVWNNWSNNTGSSGALTNPFYVAVNYFQGNPFRFLVSSNAESNACASSKSSIKIYYTNNTLWNRSNTTIISNSVYDASDNIEKATFTAFGTSLASEIVYPSLSVDGGVNWEAVSFGSEHTFSNTGKHLKWKMDINFTDPGYKNATTVLTEISVSIPSGNVSNLVFDLGNDGTADYTIDGSLGFSNSTQSINLSRINLTSFFNSNNSLVTTATYPHTYLIPLSITSDTVGTITLYNINWTYDPNPIYLNPTAIQSVLNDSINYTSFRIPVAAANTSASQAQVTFDDLKRTYAGGNFTLLIKIHDVLYTLNVSRSIDYFYSRWDYNFAPVGLDYLLFAPQTPTSINITPYGQTNTIPILNVTNQGYNSGNATLSVYLNGTLSCVNTTLSLTNSSTEGSIINDSWTTLTNLTYLQSTNISLWADYACNYSNWYIYNPQLYFRQCYYGGLCSTDLV